DRVSRARHLRSHCPLAERRHGSLIQERDRIGIRRGPNCGKIEGDDECVRAGGLRRDPSRGPAESQGRERFGSGPARTVAARRESGYSEPPVRITRTISRFLQTARWSFMSNFLSVEDLAARYATLSEAEKVMVTAIFQARTGRRQDESRATT